MKPVYVIGEVCQLPQEHVFPRFLVRDHRWITDDKIAHELLMTTPRKFTVLGYDGGWDGTFITMPETIALDAAGFMGRHIDYRTGSVCSIPVNGRAVSMGRCFHADGCSLAVAIAGGAETMSPAPGELVVAETCVDKGMMSADFDGNGVDEAFELASFLGGGTAAEVVWGREPSADRCAGDRGFAWYETKRPDAPAIDVLGVADLDADGNRELLLAIRFRTSRTIAVYQADAGGLRLDRIALTIDSRTF